MANADVVVIGDGLIGTAIAFRCAQRGIPTVLVGDRRTHAASAAAAGLLAPVTEAHYGEEALLRLNLESASRYPAFVADVERASARSTGYRRTSTVVAARDADDNAVLAELYRFQVQLGLDVRRLRSRECRELEPALAPNVRGGILVAGDHQVDNRALLGALDAGCQAIGVTKLVDRVRAVKVDAGEVNGVETERNGAITARTVVVAAGCWSNLLDGVDPALLPPVRPVKGQLLHLRGPADVLTRNVRGIEVYLVPRGDGRVVVGATVEEMGFDPAPTAGAVRILLEGARELVPAVDEFELLEIAVGFRPGSPDNAPCLGATSVAGLLVAAGHFRNGVLLTPVTADAIAESVETGETPEVIADFSPTRFEQAATR